VTFWEVTLCLSDYTFGLYLSVASVTATKCRQQS
jgi:hypothetical protein